MNRILVTLGVALVLTGLAWTWVKRLPLFRLPGDVIIDRPGFRFFFPVTTMLLVSAAVSIVAWILRR